VRIPPQPVRGPRSENKWEHCALMVQELHLGNGGKGSRRQKDTPFSNQLTNVRTICRVLNRCKYRVGIALR
jgi:hypothetical protein